MLYLISLPAETCAGEDRTVISAQEIRQMNAVRMADVLKRVPGVKAGDSSVSIHGNYKVKVFLDGRPINDPTSSHGGVRWDMVVLENVDRIEILKGKGSLEYGDDASGGVILIITRKAGDLSGNIKTFGGNHETGELSANVRFRKGGLGVTASGSEFRTDGYKPNNDKSLERGALKFDYSPEKNRQFGFSMDILNQEKGLSGTVDYPTPYSREESDMQSFSLSGTGETIRANAYFNQGEKHNTDISKGLDKTLEVSRAGIDVTDRFNLGKAARLRIGTALQWGQAQGTSLSATDETGGALFGAWEFEPESQPFKFSAGLRASLYSAFDNSLNPEITISWQNKKTRISAAYNRAGNAPSFYQRYHESSSKLSNRDLDMETSDNYSIAVTYNPATSITTGTTIFYNRLTNRITYVRLENGMSQYQNIGRASYKGFDLFANWEAAKWLSLSCTYTYLEAKDETTGLWLTAKPRHKANVELTITPMDRLSLVAGVEARSKAYNRSDNSSTVPGYALFNLRGEYAFSRISVFTEIENITDVSWQYVDGNLAPPRTWLAGINWRF